MKNPSIKIKEHQFTLSPRKTIYWQNKGTLLISDLHLGKGVNAELNFLEKLTELEQAIKEFNINRIIILGDLFDAKSTVETSPLESLLKSLRKEIILVSGNHDVLPEQTYKDLGITKIVDELREDMFIFTHKPIKTEKLNIHGHLHPGVKNNDKSKFACFYVDDNFFCVPAFGGQTGKHSVAVERKSQVYIITDDYVKLFKLKQ